MLERRASLTGRIYKLTFAVQAFCLAKERCIPETDNFEYIYIYIHIYTHTYIYILGEEFFKRNVGFS